MTHSIIKAHFSEDGKDTSQRFLVSEILPGQFASVEWRGKHIGVFYRQGERSYVQNGPLSTRREVHCLACGLGKLLSLHVHGCLEKLTINHAQGATNEGR